MPKRLLWTLEPHCRGRFVLRELLFASLRDRAGWDDRQFTLGEDVVTAGEIWDQLQLGALGSVMIAVNQQLVGPEQVLRCGDELAFLPPFTGG